MQTTGRYSAAGATVLGGAAVVAGALPVFLTGAMAVQLTEELAFDAAGLGLCVGLYRVASACASLPLGRLADRIGATWALRLAVTIAAISSIGIIVTAATWLSLAGWLVVAGCANSLAQPGANRLLVNNVGQHRRGLAFGIKQSAPPTASMLAGLSVPLIAVTLGWRWAYLSGVVIALVVFVGLGRGRPSSQRSNRVLQQRARLGDWRILVILVTAFGFGNVTSSSVAIFFVDSAVNAGSTPQLAGTLLAVASIAAIGVRVASGIICDRVPRGHLRMSAMLLASGSIGFALLGTSQPTMMAVGVVVALAGAWGFNAVFWYALIQHYPTTPGAITGAVRPGGLAGGSLGPLFFGVITEQMSYSAAWISCGGMAVLTTATMLIAANRLAVTAKSRTSVDY